MISVQTLFVDHRNKLRVAGFWEHFMFSCHDMVYKFAEKNVVCITQGKEHIDENRC